MAKKRRKSPRKHKKKLTTNTNLQQGSGKKKKRKAKQKGGLFPLAPLIAGILPTLAGPIIKKIIKR